MRSAPALVAPILAALPGVAAAATTPCLTPGEFTALAGYALPSVISGTTQRCQTTLGADAYLRRSGKDLASRYAAQKARHWPGARAAFLKIGTAGSPDNAKLLGGMPDTSLQPIVDGMVEGVVSQQIEPGKCATIDRVVRLLAPLPPENTAELIALAVGLGSKPGATGQAKVGKFNICPA